MIQKLAVLIILILLGCGLQAQGIDFHHGTWAEAVEKAQAEDKILFVDGFATWCGPCKALARNVFPKENVGDFFNEHFINVKMDMEKGEGPKFRKTYPVSAFPTLYFIAPSGEVVHKTKGAPRTPEALIDLARKATLLFDRSAAYMKKYDTGDRSYETMYGLVKGLNKSNKPSLRYANEYLRDQEDLSTENNLKFLFEALTQVDTRIFKYFITHQGAIEKLFSADVIATKIEKAAKQTVMNAIDFESPELLAEAQNKFGQLYPNKSTSFNAESNMTYAAATSDGELFLKSFKAGDFDDKKQKELIQVGLNKFSGNEKVLKSTEKWAKALAQKENTAGAYYLLAMTQVKQEKVDHAIKSLEKCIAKSEEKTPEMKLYMEQLRRLKSK